MRSTDEVVVAGS